MPLPIINNFLIIIIDCNKLKLMRVKDENRRPPGFKKN
jgi:hypothetical protein